MIGRFVATTAALQQRCKGPDGYTLTENRAIGQLFDVPTMDYDVRYNHGSTCFSLPHMFPVDATVSNSSA